MSVHLKKLGKRILRRMMGALTNVQTDASVVALTFDDGPHPEYTPRLLELLDHHQAHATFFVVGKSAQKHRAIIERMARAGHAIGNHTWDHPSFPTLKRAERWSQLRAWEKAVAPYGTKLFRPPYGNLTLSSNIDTWLHGYQVVTWNVLGRDWQNDSADLLAERIATGLHPGSIVLLHDALLDAESADAFSRENTLAAVESTLQRFSGKLRFVTVPELMKHGRSVFQNWERPPNIAWLNTLHRQPD